MQKSISKIIYPVSHISYNNYKLAHFHSGVSVSILHSLTWANCLSRLGQ
jgi:hypothetical protein